MATVGGFLPPPASSRESERGFSAGEFCIAVVRVAPKDDRRTVSSVKPASRSLGVRNFFINSARTVGEASLIDLPLMMVTFDVFGVANVSAVWFLPMSLLPATRGRCSASAGSACLKLTAVNPSGGD